MKQITVRLKPSQLLKEEIEKTARAENIGAGVLLSIVGGLENAVLRMPGSTPEDPKVKKWNGPFEIVSGTGTISRDGCHIHVSISDRDGNVLGGHLKDGCVVRSAAEVVLGVFDDVAYSRALGKGTGFKELKVDGV